MTVSNLRSIFVQVNKIFNHTIVILGFNITLYQVILFDIIVFLVLHAILSLFHKD